MSALDSWRGEIRPLIPRGFLRRDQGSGLLISDFPRFFPGQDVENALRARGFHVERMDQLARIDGSMEKYRQLANQLQYEALAPDQGEWPLYALGLRLEKRKVPLEAQPMEWIRFTMKCLDAHQEGEIMRLLPPGIALLQRLHRPLPSLAGALILDDLFHRRKGAEAEC